MSTSPARARVHSLPSPPALASAPKPSASATWHTPALASAFSSGPRSSHTLLSESKSTRQLGRAHAACVASNWSRSALQKRLERGCQLSYDASKPFHRMRYSYSSGGVPAPSEVCTCIARRASTSSTSKSGGAGRDIRRRRAPLGSDVPSPRQSSQNQSVGGTR
eukprot:121110-Pleurochrysis_carterae.AAC.1